MKIHRFERRQTVAWPIEKTFDFFTDPENLEKLTPDFLRFHFLGELPARISPGLRIEYRLRLYGVPIRWRTLIETVEPPKSFVDVQERGPYAYWRHAHLFRPVDGEHTEIIDEVEFAMRFGPLGEIARGLFVARSLERIFDYRSEMLSVLFGEE